MINIEITEKTKSAEEMVDVLNQIAEMVKKGYTKGYGWEMTIEEDEVEKPL